MEVGRYGTVSPDELRRELCELCDYLAAHHVLLAGALSDHQRVYWAAYEASTGESVSARSKQAERTALAHSVNVIEIRGEINSFIVKIDLLRYLLGVPGHTSMVSSFPPEKGLSS